MFLSIALALLLQAPLTPDEEAQRTLRFSQSIPPEVDMNLVDAIHFDMEIPLSVDDVALAKTRTPSLGDWVVARGICADTHTKCRITIRFAGYFGTNPRTAKKEFFARYVVKATEGDATFEGFCSAPSDDFSRHVYWQRHAGFWKPTVEAAEKARDGFFVSGMLDVYGELQKNEQKPTPTTKPPASSTILQG